MDLYYMIESPPCRTVLMVAKYLDISLNLKSLDLNKQEQLKPEFVKINPEHTVPTLVDHDFVLWESRAIITYLVNKLPTEESLKLYPLNAKKRATIDRLLQYDLSLSMIWRSYIYPLFQGAAFESLDKKNLEKFFQTLEVTESSLLSNRFLAGSDLSLADFSLLATLNLVEDCGHDLSRFKNITRWVNQMIKELPFYDELNRTARNNLRMFVNGLKQKISNVVASHYNQLEEKGKEARKDSRIYYMRNFNNWIKSVVIGNMLERIKERQYNQRINVLDIGCGKGGDLLKYNLGRISYIVCTDIAQTSLEQCQDRYNEMARKNRNLFKAEFIAADSTRVRLKGKFRDPSIKFHLTSVQFSFHYCFESLEQAECMIRNASESLQVGGYFIGTTPDSFEIIRRLRKSGSNKFGNEVYSITFSEDFDSNSTVPLFGTKYDFHLEGVVDCPEFLVHFPTVVEMAKKHGLKFLFKKSFDDFFQENRNHQNLNLLNRMDALESYPNKIKQLAGPESDYKTAQDFLANLIGDDKRSLGTISSSEWDAITLYVVFAFQKILDPHLSKHQKTR